MRPSLYFVKNCAYVFADNSQKDKLKPAEDGEENNERCIAGRQCFERKKLNNRKKRVEKPEERERKTEENCHAQGLAAERNDARETEGNETRQRIFALSGAARVRRETHRGLIKTEPRKDAAEKEIPLSYIPAQNPRHAARNEPKIRSIAVNWHIRNFIEKPIKDVRTPLAREGLVGCLLTDGVHNIIPLLKLGKQARDNRRWMLEVRIHHNHCIGVRMVNAGKKLHLMPEAGGKIKNL